jgi:hypothetical protein
MVPVYLANFSVSIKSDTMPKWRLGVHPRIATFDSEPFCLLPRKRHENARYTQLEKESLSYRQLHVEIAL